MADPYTNALHRLGAIERQISDLERERQSVSQFLQMYKQFADLEDIQKAALEAHARAPIQTVAAHGIAVGSSSGTGVGHGVLPALIGAGSGTAEAMHRGRLVFSSANYRSAKQAILETCAKLLADGVPRPTRQLISTLEEVGVEIGGKDKILTVSKILGNDARFKANRKYGWSIAQEGIQEEKVASDDGPTSSELFD